MTVHGTVMRSKFANSFITVGVLWRHFIPYMYLYGTIFIFFIDSKVQSIIDREDIIIRHGGHMQVVDFIGVKSVYNAVHHRGCGNNL